MPEFSPSEVKTARAPITVQPSGLSCSAELYLVSNGAKMATSGIKQFTSTGAKQDISLPITMPSAEGTYPVYLDIFTNGLLIGAYKTVEDVVIAAPVPQFYMPSKISGRAKYAPLLDWHYWYVDFWNPITNEGNVAGTVRLTWFDSLGFIQGTMTMALEPGETKEWRVGAGKRIDFTRTGAYSITLIGDWAGNNMATISVRRGNLLYIRGSDWVDV